MIMEHIFSVFVRILVGLKLMLSDVLFGGIGQVQVLFISSMITEKMISK